MNRGNYRGGGQKRCITCFLRDKCKRKSMYEGQREKEREEGYNGVKTERKCGLEEVRNEGRHTRK